jgi:hypothetical protein
MASGVPFPQAINVTNRGNGVGDTLVLLDPLGELIVGFSIIPSMDVFNLTNTNTVLSRRRNQYTFNGTTAAGSTPDNANLISSIISPRVIRFGLRVNWEEVLKC